MVKKFTIIASILGVSLILISWGSVGHYKISNLCSLSFNSEMSEFNDWIPYLRDHASDADQRKSSDPTEEMKHYIDIDNYNDFVSNGSIEQYYVAAVSKYGLSFINSNGTLPWATIATFDSLKNCLKRHDFTKSKQFAADLGHYVGDGHMPLHITANYDGKSTGNNGIHSRYESSMIDTYNSEITYTGETISEITDVSQYVFNYIYANNKYVDSILFADNYAVNLAGGTRSESTYNSSTYKQALWNKTKVYTTMLFKNASHALAELIYTAWVQAGKPSLTSTDVQNPSIQYTETLEQNVPNPFSSYTSIRYNLYENANVLLQVKDILGNNITTLHEGFQTPGSYSVDWTPKNQPEGIYFVVLDTKKQHQVKKMLLVK